MSEDYSEEIQNIRTSPSKDLPRVGRTEIRGARPSYSPNSDPTSEDSLEISTTPGNLPLVGTTRILRGRAGFMKRPNYDSKN